ncbi:MAG TPA: hypothetical protein VHT70_04825 [Candidatus Saccharimonadales bacterium]|jgi:hypothetical protein|nr:hypothetical protein [Candidatus Saccharimonadales bacterium]
MTKVNRKQRVLIMSHDKVGTQMAGPGIRYHYMAETLAETFDVTLGFFGPENVPDKAFKHSYKVRHIDVHQFHDAFRETDVVIALWVSDAIIDFCNKNGKLLIFDIYAPVPVENLAVKIFSGTKMGEAEDFEFMSQINDYRKFLENGDAFLYSNKQQLDFWLGYAFGAGQVSPTTFSKRNVYNQFIKAPMGIDTSIKLKKGAPLYKGVLKGVGKDDIVMIWNGGIYNWYDGVTLIEAMRLVWKRDPRIKMIFPGTEHPTPSMRKWQETIDTVHKAKELQLIGKNVFFFDSWIPYHERLNFLLEADLGIYTHKPSIETEFSHRTRVLDHILAKLPTIATRGDYFAILTEQEGLGRTVPAFDPELLADAIIEASKPEALARARKNIERIRPDFDWKKTMAPLIAYLLSNPQKVPKATPLQGAPTPLRSQRLALVKRMTPKIVKKAILKAAPADLKRKLMGK